MGKRIIARARGKGGPRYRAPSHRYVGKVEYKPFTTGKVVDILHDPGRSAPVMIIKTNEGEQFLNIAPMGIKVGDTVYFNSQLTTGSIAQLKNIPEGTKIFGIETYPGSGPKLCRSAGSYATVVGKTKDKVIIQLASGKLKELDEKCLATIGVPAAAGIKEKPWVKAGKKHIAMQARGKLYPRVKANVMNPVDHPFGGKSHRPRQKVVSRHAPPGAKVGSIAARRVGVRKRRKKQTQ